MDDESILFHHPAHASITDPSTADASLVVFDRELPLEVRHTDDQDSNLGTLLTIKVKLLVLYKENNTPESVRVELSRDTDLFFHMYHSLQEKGFAAMQARQKLMIEFNDYPHMLITYETKGEHTNESTVCTCVAIRCAYFTTIAFSYSIHLRFPSFFPSILSCPFSNFNKCIKDPHNVMAVLYIHRDGSGRMDFIQNLQFKFVRETMRSDTIWAPFYRSIKMSPFRLFFVGVHTFVRVVLMLCFVQVELLSVDFLLTPSDVIKQHVSRHKQRERWSSKRAAIGREGYFAIRVSFKR